MVVLILLIMVPLASLAALCLFLQARWELDNAFQAVLGLASRIIPVPTVGKSTFKRRSNAWGRRQVMVMNSGTTFPAVCVARMSPETADRMTPGHDYPLLAHDLARVLVALAKRDGISIPSNCRVEVVLDLRAAFGWILSASDAYGDPAAGVAPVHINPTYVRPGGRTRGASVHMRDEPSRARSSNAPLTARSDAVTASMSPTTPMAAPTTQYPAREYQAADAKVGSSAVTEASTILVMRQGSRVVHVASREHTVGRDPDCDIVLDDPAASRVHARMVLHRGQYQVLDENSSNGTTVNANYLMPGQAHTLTVGDRVSFGGDPGQSWLVEGTAGRP